MSRPIGLGDRGRVPFAVVGVLLLVTSATFTVALSDGTHQPEPAVDVEMERTVADARAAFRQAVTTAAVAAASAPVIEPANTTYGRVLDGERAFRDALRVRIYLAARRQFPTLTHRRERVRTNVSLARITSAAAMERAMERVTIERAGPDRTQLQATVENVTVTARRGETVVGRRRVTLSVRVDTPVLAVHDRVAEFVDRLHADVDEPGLTQRVTAKLYALAWTRGYAQYGGAPIQNVVANRHLEVLTNGAVLGIQRSVFGRSDPDGQHAHGLAALRAGAMDLATPALRNTPGPAKLTEQALRTVTKPREGAGTRELDGLDGAPQPNRTIEVDVGMSADMAFDRLVGTPLNRTLRSVYSASVRAIGATETVDPVSPPRPPTPDGDWSLVGNHTERTVLRVENATDGPTVAPPPNYHRLATYNRTVTVRVTRSRTWQRGDRQRETTSSRTGRVRTTVALVGRHAKTKYAPDRPIATVHERGGPFDGPNLRDVAPKARDSLRRESGPDSLARRAALGTLPEGSKTVRGGVPSALFDHVYLSVAALRDRLRNVSVSVERGKLGTFQASPAKRLARRIRANRSELLDAPRRYPHVVSKATVAARGRYVRAVLARLEARANERDKRANKLDSKLRAEGNISLGEVRNALAGRTQAGTGRRGPALEYHVDGAPPYLTLGGLDRQHLPSLGSNETVHPLVARNVNVGTIPYADVVSGIVSTLTPGVPKSNLRTAAKALRAANRTLAAAENSTLDSRRDKLLRKVSDSVGDAGFELAQELTRHGLRDQNATAIVRDALAKWGPVHARALAVANGSAAQRVGTIALRRAPAAFESNRSVDELRVGLRSENYGMLDTNRIQVNSPAINRTAEAVKTVGTAQLTWAAGEGIAKVARMAPTKKWGTKLAGIPAGIPITPVPGYWYATMNLWSVTVRGEYERFVVETPRATPAPADASLQYVRDGANVTVDVNGDGVGERLGRASRVTFGISTTVVVVVPPYKTGVGDVNGEMFEPSPGWPLPGRTSRSPESWRYHTFGWQRMMERMMSCMRDANRSACSEVNSNRQGS